MAQHRGKIGAVMIGVGAAFDYHAGTLKRAPAWMQERGLEWLYRMMKEPTRLWRRYLITNTIFLLRIVRQFLEHRKRTISALQLACYPAQFERSSSRPIQLERGRSPIRWFH